MGQLTLEVEKREESGKGVARRIRREGRIPGVLYGDGKEPVALSVDTAGVESILSSRTGSWRSSALPAPYGGHPWQTMRPRPRPIC